MPSASTLTTLQEPTCTIRKRATIALPRARRPPMARHRNSSCVAAARHATSAPTTSIICKSRYMVQQIQLYISRQANGIVRYVWEQLIMTLAGWIPGILGIAARTLIYRAILHMDGSAAIEDGVRIR